MTPSLTPVKARPPTIVGWTSLSVSLSLSLDSVLDNKTKRSGTHGGSLATSALWQQRSLFCSFFAAFFSIETEPNIFVLTGRFLQIRNERNKNKIITTSHRVIAKYQKARPRRLHLSRTTHEFCFLMMEGVRTMNKKKPCGTYCSQSANPKTATPCPWQVNHCSAKT